MVSSRDVARLAKVSQSTVSRAYREDVYIDPNTRKRVFEAAKQLGTIPISLPAVSAISRAASSV